jgi:hypothetical protein
MPRKVPQNSSKNPARDVCYTPSYAVEPLLPYLKIMDEDRRTITWESACGAGYLANTLAHHGLDVWATDLYHKDKSYRVDFLRYKWGISQPDYQITNPPFSLKYDWLRRSYLSGIPFALLLPSATMFSAYAQRLFTAYGVSILMPSQRIDFKTPVRGWDSSAQFHSSWFCWRMPGLRKGVTYCKLNKPKKLDRPFEDSDMLIYLKEG